jgi:quaternary ammonium compound-resistance protein SugE
MTEPGRTAVAWGILVCAGLLEIVWALALKHAAGFTRLWPSLLGVAAAFTSLLLLTIALRTLPVATAYTVWVGIGAAGVTTAGILIFDERASLLRLAFLALILIGVVGLRFVER